MPEETGTDVMSSVSEVDDVLLGLAIPIGLDVAAARVATELVETELTSGVASVGADPTELDVGPV